MARNQRKYNTEYKVQAIKLSNEIGSSKAAVELGIPVDALPEVRQQNTHHDPGAYGTGRFSAVLPQVQVYLRDPLQRRENGRNGAGKGMKKYKDRGECFDGLYPNHKRKHRQGTHLLCHVRSTEPCQEGMAQAAL